MKKAKLITLLGLSISLFLINLSSDVLASDLSTISKKKLVVGTSNTIITKEELPHKALEDMNKKFSKAEFLKFELQVVRATDDSEIWKYTVKLKPHGTEFTSITLTYDREGNRTSIQKVSSQKGNTVKKQPTGPAKIYNPKHGVYK